jgi:hypothetical protein
MSPPVIRVPAGLSGAELAARAEKRRVGRPRKPSADAARERQREYARASYRRRKSQEARS